MGKRFETRLSELLDTLDMRVQGMQRGLTRRFGGGTGDVRLRRRQTEKTTEKRGSAPKLERLFDGFEKDVIQNELALLRLNCWRLAASRLNTTKRPTRQQKPQR